MVSMSVFIADDHPVVRSGLKTVVEAEVDMEVVGEAPDGLAALEGVQRLRPDVVVMDLAMPKLAGPEATNLIKAACPEVKVLVLTAHDERGYVQMALSAGASGFVLKRSASED